MRWNTRYVVKSYVKSSLWIVPFAAIVAHLIFSRFIQGLGDWLTRTGRIDPAASFYGVSLSGARTIMETVVTANLSFIVFTFGSLLVAIQVAGGQYTPRIIATTLLRDNKIRFIVGYFVFTWFFTLRALAMMGETALNQFNTFVCGMLGLVSVVVFLYLIDYAARFLRPVSLVKRVGEAGIAVIGHVHDAAAGSCLAAAGPPGTPQKTVLHAGTSGVVLAVFAAGLVELARKANGVIEFVPQVGDFVAVDEPLFRLYGGAASLDDAALRGAVALGSERTLEQDPTFAFRILVDIAIKALSPAINDPTTAVLAMDQLHRLLRRVGLRHCLSDAFADERGIARLHLRTPKWEDFVHLACTEIRHYGASNVQIARRMRSMLENLIQTLPEPRHAQLRGQLRLLDREVEQLYKHPEDRAIAGVPDPQGLGGSIGVGGGPGGIFPNSERT